MKRRGAVVVVLKALGVVVLLAMALIIAGRFLVQPWPERAPGVVLEPARPILREADVTPDNGYYYLRQIVQPSATSQWDKTCFSEFAACGWGKGTSTQLEAWVQSMEPAQGLLRSAADCTNNQVPSVDSFTMLVPYVSPFLTAARSACVMAEQAAARGDWEEAGEHYRAALQTADQVSRGGSVLHVLVNIAVARVACDSMRRTVIERTPSSDFLMRMEGLLGEIDRDLEPFSECIRYEYLCWRNGMSEFYRAPRKFFSIGDAEGQTEGAWFNVIKWPALWLMGSTPARTLGHMAATCSQMILLADVDRFPRRSFAMVVPGFELAGLLQTIGLFTDDGMGRILMTLLVPAMDNAMERYWGHRVALRGTRCVLAIRAYELKTGRVPDRLEELVPGYLSAVPDDCFAPVPSPFRFAKRDDGWVVYSVGPDGVDNRARHDWLSQSDRAAHGAECDVIFGLDESARRCEEYVDAQSHLSVGVSCPRGD